MQHAPLWGFLASQAPRAVLFTLSWGHVVSSTLPIPDKKARSYGARGHVHGHRHDRLGMWSTAPLGHPQRAQPGRVKQGPQGT